MRLVWMCAVIAGCSAPAANEALPAGPPPSPRTCKDADLVATMQNEAATANVARVDQALDAYAAARHVTVDPAPLHGLSLDEMGTADADVRRAWAADQFVVESGGRMLVVETAVENRDGCGAQVDADYRLATMADGTPLLLRLSFTRRTTAHVEQCGVCTKGCGDEPFVPDWLGWIVPVPAGTHPAIAPIPVTLDELDVTCERTMPAE